jgi:hypothetical protein
VKLSSIARKILENDYKGVHKAPSKSNGAPLHDLTQIYPDDIYSNKAVIYYGDRATDYSDQLSISIMHSAKGKPDAKIKIYRAVPSNIQGDINAGDWVTINKQYAVTHGERTLEGSYRIISKVVPAKHLYTDANSIHEFGYDPS